MSTGGFTVSLSYSALREIQKGNGQRGVIKLRSFYSQIAELLAKKKKRQ